RICSTLSPRTAMLKSLWWVTETVTQPWSEKEFQRLHTFAQIVAVVTEQIQNRVSNNVAQRQLNRLKTAFFMMMFILIRAC
ncbi:hypothetical protein NL292_25835, partial [Klebsiella pneumoniae]|nr:hypothetical protein [Klebsiella pneumoniae]